MSYSKLNEKNCPNESVSDDDSPHDFLLPCPRNHDQMQHRSRLRQYMSVVTKITVCSLIFASGIIAGTRIVDRDVSCTRHVSQDSPLLNHVDISYTTQRFNGSLFKENVFRKTGSPEVDAAWESLGVNYDSVILSEKDARQAGLRPDQVKIRPKYGGGYPANVEGLHQLHCLNLLRQSLYYNYDYYKKLKEGAFLNSDRVLKAHVSHCVDMLRQQLMCTVDIGFIGQIWTNPSDLTPFVDFSTEHKCRDFEAVRRWAEEHQFPVNDQPEDGFIEPPKPDDFIYPEIP